MKPFFLIIIFVLTGFAAPITFAQEENAEESEADSTPLRVTIRPMPKYRFGDTFSYGGDQLAPKLDQLFLCPPGALFDCAVFERDPLDEGDPFTLRLNKVVAAYVYENYQQDFGRQDLGLLMGGRYYGVPNYVILASFGIDPDLKPLTTMPRPTGAMYGNLWFADTLSLADRIGGPIMLTRGGDTQIKRLKPKDDDSLGF